jgi:hypothetical protein
LSTATSPPREIFAINGGFLCFTVFAESPATLLKKYPPVFPLANRLGREHKCPHFGPADRLFFCDPVTNAFIPRDDNPVLLSDGSQPLWVLSILTKMIVVDLGPSGRHSGAPPPSYNARVGDRERK